MRQSPSRTYAGAGVIPAGGPLSGLLGWVNRTLSFRQDLGAPVLGIGHYANVLRIGDNLGLAISTDSVGSKVLVAELLGKYDTLDIDCIAMNANDVLCVGAEPIALVDYIAVQEARADVLEQLGRGLYEGARQANITIPGGELAQLPEVVQGDHPGTGLPLLPGQAVRLGRRTPGNGVRVVMEQKTGLSCGPTGSGSMAERSAGATGLAGRRGIRPRQREGARPDERTALQPARTAQDRGSRSGEQTGSRRQARWTPLSM